MSRNSGLCLGIDKYLTFLLFIGGITCFTYKLVLLNVPPQARNGSEVQLSCLYDLGNVSLYSLKWFYRNPYHENSEEQEFYRYTPRGKPIKQVFPLEGINVDFRRSDGGTVYLKDVDGRTGGYYKCEISVEGVFQTVFSEKPMVIFENTANSTTRLSPTEQLVRIIILMFNLIKIIFWL